MSIKEIRETFNAEAKEILDNLESDVVKLEEDPRGDDVINRIFRYIHTLKGSSGIAGVTIVYEFSHDLENLLDEVRSGNINVSNKIIDLILDCIDWIKENIFTENADPATSVEKMKVLIDRIEVFRGGKTPETETTGAAGEKQTDADDDGFRYFNVKAFFKNNIFNFGIDPLMVIEDLASLGEIITNNVIKRNLPLFKDMKPEICYFGWDLVIKTRASDNDVENIFIFVMDDNDIIIENITSRYIKKKIVSGIDYDKKIGEIMLESGVISENELKDVVTIQDSEKNKLGDIIVKKGYASEGDVHSALQNQEKIKKKIELNTVRVDTIKLDNLLNLLGEIVIGQSALSKISDEMDNEYNAQLKNALYGLDRSTREFQEQIMSIRMIPIGPTFEQFRRFVRDSARTHDKEIKFVVEEGETELDKTVIEKIGDPLKHMIRNSIDHGIERPDERIARGKKRSGKITLKAYHQEGNVFIEIIDDGKGISINRVKEKAVALNIVKPEEEVTKEKLMSFLFLPGFSTSEKIGELSGRGVGMDVVKTNIESLRGSVEIKSEEGEGSVIRIKLPLTLAIIDSMLVKIGMYVYIIPLLAVVETVRPMKEDIKTVEGKGEILSYRGEFLSLVRLYDIFGVKAQITDPWEGLVVIVESNNIRIGLLIDDMIGQQQIVIKSLDNFITKSRAVSGASILGDGRVALIVDIFGLIEDLEV